MKKILVGLLLGITVFATACGSSQTSTETSSETESVGTDLVTSEVSEESAETESTVESTVASTEESTAETTTSSISSFEDVNTDAVSLIALGNSDVPVGQYSEEIFENLGIWDAIQSKISYGSTVKEVLSQVEEGAVDCGVVYATDAATSDGGIKVVATADDSLMDTPVVYPVATVNTSENQEAADAFINFLSTDEAVQEFENVGFTMADTNEAEDITTDAECTLNVFAAASLTESLSAIEPLFEAEYPNIDVVFNFDSSGTLETQIENGAEADVFFSAAEKQMTALIDAGYVEDGSQEDLLKNSVVLIVPES